MFESEEYESIVDTGTTVTIEPKTDSPQRVDPREKIKISGVSNICCLGEDTYSNPERFFSHRYETNNKKAITGRMMNIIGLFK